MKNILLAVSLSLALTGCINTGDGEKVGSIVKTAKQGAWCPTYEAEIIRGGFSNGSGVSGQPFHFTIENQALFEQVKHYMDTQQEVKITYRTEGITWCRSESNDNFLVSIEPLGKQADRPLEVKATDQAVNNVTVVEQDSKDAVESHDEKVLRLLENNQELIKELALSK